MSVRLAISVEGQTEERFVKDLLYRHLLDFDVYAEPKIVATGWAADGKRAKGGGINTDRVVRELRALLAGFDAVTSFYDFYGFEDRQPRETAEELQERLADRLQRPRNLIPYVQLHEFEALLLSDAAVAADYFGAPSLEPIMRRAVDTAGGAERVNDSPATAPSKRLENWTTQHAPLLLRFSKKTKVRHGTALAERVGLPAIRRACPRFDRWIDRLERLTAE